MVGQRTSRDGALLVGGLALVISGALGLLTAASVRLPLSPTYTIVFHSFWPNLLANTLFAAGMCAVARGRGLGSAVARPRAVRALLLLFGIAPLIEQLVLIAPVRDATGCIVEGVALVGAVSGLVAGIELARARFLAGSSRWAILVAAVLQAIAVGFGLLWDLPLGVVLMSSGLIEVSITTSALVSFAVAGAGLVFALRGRAPRVQRAILAARH